ncbi:MAG: DUF2157 domain-containing protein [Pseudomonadota bacterium]|nr:DUF2157 domain-containing protein [Pseudomonadota bacterium]
MPYSIVLIEHAEMSINPLEQPASSQQLFQLAQRQMLSPKALDTALSRIGVIPGISTWQVFIEKLFLILGSVFIIVGVVFFFAYNWHELHHFAKFALLQITLLSCVGLSLSWGLERLEGKIALFMAAVLVGILLAVYGQVYQTGADSFELFATWVALITPWVLSAYFAPLWLLAIILLNLSIILYWQQVIAPIDSETVELFLVLFGLNGITLLAWEWGFQRQLSWLRGIWFARLLFVAALGSIMVPTVVAIADNTWYSATQFAGLGYVLTTIVALSYYSWIRIDLVLLTFTLGGILISLTTWIGHWLSLEQGWNWLILAFAVIVQASLAAKGLQLLTHKQQA